MPKTQPLYPNHSWLCLHVFCIFCIYIQSATKKSSDLDFMMRVNILWITLVKINRSFCCSRLLYYLLLPGTYDTIPIYHHLLPRKYEGTCIDLTLSLLILRFCAKVLCNFNVDKPIFVDSGHQDVRECSDCVPSRHVVWEQCRSSARACLQNEALLKPSGQLDFSK